jgi:hypothetical protein
MKYLLLVYAAEDAYAAGEREACFEESKRLVDDLRSKGQYLGASPLRSVSTATSVRVRGGKRMVTDGPFAETREQLGGYYLVDAANLDDAIDIAGRIPGARKGTVEVRPIEILPGINDG